MPKFSEIIDQPRPIPPAGDYGNRNWLLWTLSATLQAYGFAQSVYLGLARPLLGLKNADNYAVFALCVQYPTLDCVGLFQAYIVKREKLPFQPAPEAVKRIRKGEWALPLGYGNN